MPRAAHAMVLGVLMMATPAAADTLRLSNCSVDMRTVLTFNEGDGVCLIARSQAIMPSCGSVSFTCEGKCKVQVQGASSSNCSLLDIESGEVILDKNGGLQPRSSLQGADPTRWFQYCQCGEQAISW